MRPRVSCVPLLVGVLLAATALPAHAQRRGAAKTTPAKAAAEAPVRYETGPTGNAARYRVRERLAGKTLDNDAVGETTQVSGTLVLDAGGQVVADSSRFSATVAGLTSDEKRRDRYVRNRILVTDSFPTTTFQATAVRGLPAPLPTSGTVAFDLVGNLTVKGVTRPATWQVTATVQGDQLMARAVTRFTFADFRLLQPKVSILLGVADTIALEYDVAMRRTR
jgi:polyisoprenoid-binding protein YceI